MAPLTLRIPATIVDDLTTELLQSDALERAALCACAPSGDNLVVADCTVVPDTEMRTLTATGCRPNLEYEYQWIDECIGTDRHPLLIHSHPFADTAQLSETDTRTAGQQADWIHTLYDCHLLIGVLGKDELRIEQVHPDWSRNLVTTAIVGDWTLTHQVTPVTPDVDSTPDTADVPATTKPTPAPSTGEDDRHDRTERVYGAALQDLQETHVAVAGCGGIGSLLVQGLTGLGVQRVTFIDPDRVEQSNLPRLPQATDNDVGRYKVDVMQEWYSTQVPGAETTTITLPVQDTASHLADLDVDVLLGGLDRITPRVWLSKYAARHLIPYIDAGSQIGMDDDTQIDRMTTMVQTYVPGTDTGCFVCVGRVDTDRMQREGLSDAELAAKADEGYIPDTALTPAPAVTHLNMAGAAEAIDQLVRLVTRNPAPPLNAVRYESVEKALTDETTHRSNACDICTRFTGTGDTGPVAHAAVNLDTFDDLETGPTTEQASPTPDMTQQHRLPATVTAYFTHIHDL